MHGERKVGSVHDQGREETEKIIPTYSNKQPNKCNFKLTYNGDINTRKVKCVDASSILDKEACYLVTKRKLNAHIMTP